MLFEKEDIYRGPLILVNAGHPIRDSGVPAEERLAAPCAGQPEVRMEARAAALLHALLEEIGGREKITMISGYRPWAEQVKIFEDSLRENGEAYTRRFVALPGRSEHQTGLAIDVAKAAEDIDFICPDFPDEGVCRAFRRRAADYGFVERYPEDKQEVTGIGGEPWHFRYVGYPHAVIMKEKELCLEEYVEYLRGYSRKKPLVWRDGREEFEIYSAAAEELFCESREDPCVQVSGNNVDGLIVTVWKRGECDAGK